jgi:dienelactone hydrolase
MFAAAAFVAFLSGCVTCCPPEKRKAPDELCFRKTTIALPSGVPCPAWHTRSPGKPVLLLHALNGISPSTLGLALEMEHWGYRVYVPSLYGDLIEGASAFGYDDALAAAKFIQDDPRWNLYDLDQGPGAILEDVRAMVRFVSRREGGRSITVIGNCLTGSFPLALMSEPAVQTGVLAQPAMPLLTTPQVLLRIPQKKEIRRSTGLSPGQWEKTIAALRNHPDKHLIGFHYRNDPLAPIRKFDTIQERLSAENLGDRFHAFVLAPTGMFYAKKRPDWVTGGPTEQQTTLLTPHSTIINPVTKEDRNWFRARLREALAR